MKIIAKVSVQKRVVIATQTVGILTLVVIGNASKKNVKHPPALNMIMRFRDFRIDGNSSLKLENIVSVAEN